jgi:hypothetical protein
MVYSLTNTSSTNLFSSGPLNYILQFYIKKYEQGLGKKHKTRQQGGFNLSEPACPFRLRRI